VAVIREAGKTSVNEFIESRKKTEKDEWQTVSNRFPWV